MHYNKQNLIELLTAIFLVILITSIPWELVREREFSDVLNYLNNIIGISTYGFDTLFRSNIVSMISQEIVWGYILKFIGESSIEPKFALFCISIFSLFIISYFTLKNSDLYISLFIICNPLMVMFVFDQVRSSFAFSIILIGLLLKKKHILILLMCLSLFIHTAMIIPIFGLVVSGFILKLPTENVLFKKLFVSLSGLLIAFTITYGLSYLLGMIGDRRAEYSDIHSSLLFGSFWYLALIAIVFSKEISKETLLLIFLLAVFTFTNLMGGYGSRFIPMLSPLFAITLSNIERDYMKLIFIAYIFNTFIQWLFFLKIIPF